MIDFHDLFLSINPKTIEKLLAVFERDETPETSSESKVETTLFEGNVHKLKVLFLFIFFLLSFNFLSQKKKKKNRSSEKLIASSFSYMKMKFRFLMSHLLMPN